MPRRNPSLVGAKLSHQSARTPKQIRNLLSRRASSRRFPATNTASNSQAFTCAETGTIEPARIEESSLSNVRSEHAGGLFVPFVGPGDCVVRGQVPARRALAQQRRSASVGATRATAGAHPAKAAHSIRHAVSHRLLSRKRRPRRGRQRRPPPTARPRRCGPDAGCEGSPQEAAALQSRRRWHHLGGR